MSGADGAVATGALILSGLVLLIASPMLLLPGAWVAACLLALVPVGVEVWLALSLAG